MIHEDAEAYLTRYRALLKAWTMAVAGFADGDSDMMFHQLETGQKELARIAEAFPEKSYDIDMLINSRSRSWAGFTAERLPRPAHRRT
ncbi:MAG: hypothetical protein JWQ22_3304 [Devosia sp.]|nr:hypothetical protein [Devosia sp.]